MDKRKDVCAPRCDDQLPVFSRVGRGIQGDGFYVEVADPDTTNETHLEGFKYDAASKEWSSEWVSENINGGELRYQYNLRPFTVPQTFTITFIYKRPGRPEWSWTTPAIPYIWTVDEDGGKQDPDATVGSGVATLFIRKTTEEIWTEKLIYPEGTDRFDYNAPEAEKPWTVNLVFGIGGDVDVPNIDDIAKILGITVQDIRNIIAGNDIIIDGLTVDNIVDFIKKADDRLSDHIHADMGFNSKDHTGETAFGGYATVKAYIDAQVAGLQQQVTHMQGYIDNMIEDVLNKFYGGGSIDEDGNITWGDSNKAAVGNINLFGNSSLTSYIRTRSGTGENDVRIL